MTRGLDMVGVYSEFSLRHPVGQGIEVLTSYDQNKTFYRD